MAEEDCKDCYGVSCPHWQQCFSQFKEIQAENDKLKKQLNYILKQVEKADKYGVGMVKVSKIAIKQVLKESE